MARVITNVHHVEGTQAQQPVAVEAPDAAGFFDVDTVEHLEDQEPAHAVEGEHGDASDNPAQAAEVKEHDKRGEEQSIDAH